MLQAPLVRLLLVVALLISVPAAFAADRVRVAFGDLIVSADPARWHVTEKLGGFVALCREDVCAGREVVGSIETSACTAESLRPDGRDVDRGLRLARTNGLDWQVATWWRGCRNAHPLSLAACTRHRGQVYRVVAAIPTCRTAPGTGSEDAILDLIGAMQPR